MPRVGCVEQRGKALEEGERRDRVRDGAEVSRRAVAMQRRRIGATPAQRELYLLASCPRVLVVAAREELSRNTSGGGKRNEEVAVGLEGGGGRMRGGTSSNDVVEHRHRFAAPSHQHPLPLPSERAVGEALNVLAVFTGGGAALLDHRDRVADGDAATTD